MVTNQKEPTPFGTGPYGSGRPIPEHPATRQAMPLSVTNADAVEKTIAALNEASRLSDTDEALVAAVRNLAAAVDAAPGNAALWREFRAALETLSEVGADDLDDDTTAFRVSVQVPRRAPVGDTPQP